MPARTADAGWHGRAAREADFRIAERSVGPVRAGIARRPLPTGNAMTGSAMTAAEPPPEAPLDRSRFPHRGAIGRTSHDFRRTMCRGLQPADGRRLVGEYPEQRVRAGLRVQRRRGARCRSRPGRPPPRSLIGRIRGAIGRTSHDFRRTMCRGLQPADGRRLVGESPRGWQGLRVQRRRGARCRSRPGRPPPRSLIGRIARRARGAPCSTMRWALRPSASDLAAGRVAMLRKAQTRVTRRTAGPRHPGVRPRHRGQGRGAGARRPRDLHRRARATTPPARR
jgi:hypothetical protein